MTDKDIIKALECWFEKTRSGYETHLAHGGDRDEHEEDYLDTIEMGLRLINRQKAEIEKLQKANESFADLGKLYSEIRAEAIKEFADLLKKEINDAIQSRQRHTHAFAD